MSGHSRRRSSACDHVDTLAACQKRHGLKAEIGKPVTHSEGGTTNRSEVEFLIGVEIEYQPVRDVEPVCA